MFRRVVGSALACMTFRGLTEHVLEELIAVRRSSAHPCCLSSDVTETQENAMNAVLYDFSSV